MQRGFSSIPCRLGTIHRSIMTYASHQAPAGVVQQPHQQQQHQHGARKQKTIYLIRHGEGFHNVGMDHNLDAHLTPRGWAQTAALNQHLRARQEQLGIQLVVVSPLRRTLETAAGVFGARAPPPSAAAAAATSAATTAAPTSAAAGMHQPGWTLMNDVSARPAEVTAQTMLFLPPVVRRRAAVAAAGEAAGGAALDAAMGATGRLAGSVSDSGAAAGHEPLKLVAYEGCRERIGPNVCDKFRDIHLQAADFPGVDFSHMAHSTDVDWEALHDATCADGGCYLSGEEESHCEARALEFYAWLMDRPESAIAVVSHCGFLAHGMRALGKSMFKSWGDAMMAQLSSGGSSTAAVSCALLPTANGFTVSPVPSALPSAQGTPFAPPGLSTGPQHPVGMQAGPQGFGAPAPSQQQVNAGGQVVPAVAGQGGGGGLLHAKAAEAVRQAATDLTGWMSADWMNCECRCIQLAWGDPAELLSEAGVVTAETSDAANSMATAGGRFLWAWPGEASAWWPGGLHGIVQQQLY